MKNPAQNLSVIRLVLGYADLATGVQTDIGEPITNGYEVVDIVTVIRTPSNSAGTDVLDIGKSGSANAYRNDTDLKAAAGTRVASTVVPGLINETTGGLQLTATRTEGAAPTAGEVLILIYLTADGREHFDV